MFKLAFGAVLIVLGGPVLGQPLQHDAASGIRAQYERALQEIRRDLLDRLECQYSAGLERSSDPGQDGALLICALPDEKPLGTKPATRSAS